MRYFKDAEDNVREYEDTITEEDIELIESARGLLLTEITYEDATLLVNPPKTFDQELSALNAKYETDLDPLVKEHSMARARNTDNESSKVIAAQAKIAALDLWYESEGDALIIKYFS